MGSAGHHERRPGEYVQPPAALDLTKYCPPGLDYFAAGTAYHQPALKRFREGQRVQVEMVPEPFNPFDCWAVALDIENRRVGYLQMNSARMWHDVVRSCNRAGLAITFWGVIRHEKWVGEDGTTSDVALEINTPPWRDLYDLAVAAGLRQQHDAIMELVPRHVRAAMVSNSWDGLDRAAVEELRRHRSTAAEFTWPPGRRAGDPSDGVPYWHIAFLREELLEQRQYAALRRELKRLLRRQLKRTEKNQRDLEARARKRRRLEQAVQAVEMQATGMSHAQIGSVLGVAASAVPALLRAGRRESPSQAIDWNAREQWQRIERVREALRLQRTGTARARIAEKLGCSIQSIKEMLSDARFYEDPSGDAGRLERARECRRLRGQGLSKDQVLEALSSSRAAGLRAYRDAAALHLLNTLSDEPGTARLD